MPAQGRPKRADKPQKLKPTPSRFAPAAFLSGSPEAVQRLCDELADLAAERFGDLTGTSWQQTGLALASQLRAAGHDLMSFDETAELQEWQASWHHPRGTFSLLLCFRAPSRVEVTWRSDDAVFTAHRGGAGPA